MGEGVRGYGLVGLDESSNCAMAKHSMFDCSSTFSIKDATARLPGLTANPELSVTSCLEIHGIDTHLVLRSSRGENEEFLKRRFLGICCQRMLE